MTGPWQEPASTQRDGIVLWGATQAGKSGFVGSLYGLLERSRESARWTAHPKDALTPHTERELTRAFLDLKDRGYRKTNVREPEPLHLIIRKLKGEQELGAVELDLLDPAGEVLTNPVHRATTIGASVYSHAARSRGLVWLVSVRNADTPRSLSQAAILPELIALLEACGGAQIRIPIAICLSMIDRLPAAEQELATSNPRAALSREIGECVPRWFEALCPNLRYFAISSAGTHDGVVDPINVSEVLDWIVEEGRRLPRRRAGMSLDLPASASLAKASTPAAAKSPKEQRADVTNRRRLPNALMMRLGGAGLVVALTTAALLSQPTRELIGSTLTQSWTRLVSGNPDNGAASSTNDTPPAVITPAPRATRSPAVNSPPIARRQTARSLDSTWRRTTAAIDAAPAGSRRVAPLRFARARACLDRRLGCEQSELIADLTWVRVSGNLFQRREAKRLLDSLGVSSKATR